MSPTVFAQAAALFALPAAAPFDFAPATVIPATGGIVDIVIADLDGDDDLDVATLTGFSFPDGRAFIGVLLNDGAGALSAGATIDLGNQVGLEFFVQDLEAGDVDGDGDVDLAFNGVAQPLLSPTVFAQAAARGNPHRILLSRWPGVHRRPAQ